MARERERSDDDPLGSEGNSDSGLVCDGSPYFRPEISKKFGYTRVRACVYARAYIYICEASPVLFVGRIRLISKGPARSRGSNWSRCRSDLNFSTGCPPVQPKWSLCPFPVASKEASAARRDPESWASPLQRRVTRKNIYNFPSVLP